MEKQEIICDHCEKVLWIERPMHFGQRANYLTLNVPNGHVVRAGLRHFCNIACLDKWFKEQGATR